MIVDTILDRKDGQPYNAHAFYSDVVARGEIGGHVADMMDGGTNEDVQGALCKYIIDNDYNRDICDYIKSVNWL